MILGIDEVGRGPWAGPLVVGAVVLGDAIIDGLTDSKKLTKKKREALDVIIREQAAGYGLGWVAAEEIDEIGLAAALRQATIRAVKQVKATYHEIIIDGTINFLKETSKGGYVTTLAKADLLVPAVSAASIIAKVARDNFMAQQEAAFPGYGFASHVGYGTAHHRQVISEKGITPLHRLSFAPLKEYQAEVTTKQKGDKAEEKVSEFLQLQGHRILDRNWRSRWCEIDIVSMKDDVLYATEVKYRKTNRQGGGVAAITSQKATHLNFAMEFYAARHNVLGKDRRIIVADVQGFDYLIKELLEIE
jgi:ribonuclease HII